MDNSSNFDSTSSVDQNDHSVSETPEYSPFSRDSFAYCRTNSEVSNLSEAVDDNSYASDPSPSPWMSAKHGAVLSRLGMKQRKHSLDGKSDDLDILELGWSAV